MDVTRLPEDLSSDERNSLIDYVQKGCPGLTRVDDQDVFGWFQLYMQGKSYQEIASLKGCQKDLIIYMAYRNQWHEKRMSYYGDISEKYIEKTKIAKMNSVNTTLNAISALGKYCDEHFNKFITSNNKDIINNLDTKILTQYFKSIEMLDKLLSNKPNRSSYDDDTSSPTVNININQPKESSTITVDAEVVENTSDSSDVLKALSILKRSQAK